MTISPTRFTRRRLLTGSISGVMAGALASVLSACVGGGSAPTSAPPAAPAGAPAAQAGPGGFSGGGTLKMLVRSHFVPAYDTWLDKWAAEWGDKNRVEVQVDHILSADLAAKVAAEVAAGAGHDLYGLTRNGEPLLYRPHMVDVSDLATQIGQQYGGWIPFAETLGRSEGSWMAVPEYFIDFPALYRKDIFDAHGLKPIDSWDELLKVGEYLKGIGNPIGIAINQKANDSNNSWTGCLWSFGGSVATQDGKSVAINSPETRAMLSFAVELYNKTMTNEVLSWDDTGNNLLLASGRGSWIQNPISALRTIEKDSPDLAQKIYISNTPAGPKGRLTPCGGNAWALAKWSTNVPAAKAFLTDFFAVLPQGIKAGEGYNQPVLKDLRKKPMPILGEDPKLNVLQDFDQVAKSVGYPGPPTPAAGEVESNWIIPLMVARAVQDGNVDGAVEWATQKIDAIYAKY